MLLTTRQEGGIILKIGFLTSCLDMKLEQKVIEASNMGFDTLEVICGEPSKSDISINDINKNNFENIYNLFNKNNISISSLAFYKNVLTKTGKTKERDNNINQLYKLIDLAATLDTNMVSTFIGKTPLLSLEDNFNIFEKLFKPLVNYAEKKSIKIAIENCSMPSWHSNGFPSTISYSPECWDEMFRRIPNSNFGLNFDPSHLIWQQIDYLDALNKYKDRIFNIHLNAIKLETNNLKRYGIFGKQLERDHQYDFGWYHSTTLGNGDLNWEEIIDILIKNNYNNNLIVEFKDKNYITNEEILTGLYESKKYTSNILKEKNNEKT